jgi:hypothetical protein
MNKYSLELLRITWFPYFAPASRTCWKEGSWIHSSIKMKVRCSSLWFRTMWALAYVGEILLFMITESHYTMTCLWQTHPGKHLGNLSHSTYAYEHSWSLCITSGLIYTAWIPVEVNVHSFEGNSYNLERIHVSIPQSLSKW